MRNAHVFLWNEKTLFGICQIDVKTENTVPCLCRSFTLKDNHVYLKVNEFHEMLFWETHVCYSEMRSVCLGYVKLLLKVRTVFLFSVEALLLKIIAFFWKCMDFMKCFCEKRTCLSLTRKALFGICQGDVKTENTLSSLWRSFTLKDN